jgi:hypothetical protein
MDPEYNFDRGIDSNHDDSYNPSIEYTSDDDSITTFFQVVLGLLSLSGCIHVFYVNCSHCYKEYSKAKNIKKRKLKKDELIERECSICLEMYQINEQVSVLPCSHYYHTRCLNEWLKKKEDCPICRIEI